MMTYYGIEGGLIDNILGLLTLIIIFGAIGLVAHVINKIIKFFKG